MALMQLIKAGGLTMWPLAFCSVVALAVILERGWGLRRSQVLEPELVATLSRLVAAGDLGRAVELCNLRPGIYTRVVGAGLEAAQRGEGRAEAKEAIVAAGRHQSARLHRFLGILGTVVGISPLLGLFGTVIGMIEVFRTISEVGAGRAAQLSGGIAQALVTTATGLLIAIPALIAYNYFRDKADGLTGDLEHEGAQLLRDLYRAPAREVS